jgi:hypothetical protein
MYTMPKFGLQYKGSLHGHGLDILSYKGVWVDYTVWVQALETQEECQL